MKTKTNAAVSLLLCAIFAFPQASLAGRGGPKEDPNRDPSNKTCEFVYLKTSASDKLKFAYDLIDDLSTNDGVFLSKKQDAQGLMCKVSGSEIKLAQDKDLEASNILHDALMKIDSLEAQGKFEDAGIREAINDAKCIIDNNCP